MVTRDGLVGRATGSCEIAGLLALVTSFDCAGVVDASILLGGCPAGTGVGRVSLDGLVGPVVSLDGFIFLSSATGRVNLEALVGLGLAIALAVSITTGATESVNFDG